MSTPDSSPSFDNSAILRDMPQNLLNLPGDSEIWTSLKQAIAASSGFQRWQLEQREDEVSQTESGLDDLIRRYLRETLETLAY
jgi:hypothetical protein